MKLVRSTLFVGLALTAASATSAHAATLATPKCVRYIPGSGGTHYVLAAGSGFFANESLRLNWGSGFDLAGYTTTNAAGGFFGAFLGPNGIIGTKRHLRSFVLTAKDANNGVLLASKKVQFVKVDVTYNIRHPKQLTRYRLYGFPSHRFVFAHYWFGGRQRAVVRIGRTTRGCGDASRRYRALPARFRVGTWNIYFTNSRRLTRSGVRHKRYLYRSRFITYIRYSDRIAAVGASAMRGVAAGRPIG